jgi:hypothetical protein
MWSIMRVGGDPRWIEKRHDTILVNYNRDNNAAARGNTMAGRRIARLWCLFKVDILGGLSLALVQWFKCSKNPENDTGMFIVTKKDEYEVIELDTIERGVHLIPHFGPIGSTPAPIPGQPHGLDAFDKFVINNHLDLEIYNMIY